MRRVILPLGLLITLLPTHAFAQSAEDMAASDALFDDAKKLVTAGDYEHACPKFEASLKLVVRLGAKLNLADCYEKAGRTASAWAAFREAAGLAAKSNDAGRESFARQRAAALEPYLAKLAIKVAASDRVTGLTITRDGALIQEAVYDTAVPVDPGDHIIQASAPGFQAWSQRISVVREKTHTVEVPKLAPEPEKKPTEVVAKPTNGSGEEEEDDTRRPPPNKTRKIVAYAVGGAGVVALGVTAVLGLSAKSKWNSASSHCDAQNRCDPAGLSLNHDARTLGNVATVTFFVGIAAVATGVVLYVTAPKQESHERAVTLAPVVGPSSAGVTLGGSF